MYNSSIMQTPTTLHTRLTQLIYILLGLGVVGVVVFLTVTYQPDPIIGTEGGAPAQTVSWASTEVDKITIDETGDQYAIKATYPVTANTSVTAYMKTFVEGEVAAFTADNIPSDIPEDSATQVYTLDITYSNERSAIADTYVFTEAIDTGGAHGLQATKTFSFTPEGKLIEVKDLFTTGASGLTVIAPYIAKELASVDMTTAEWIAEGTAPIEDNYQNFIITDTGVQFIFDPYQVAAYAAGIQRVEVPVSVFQSIANKNIFR